MMAVTAAACLVGPAALGGGAVASHTGPGSPATTRVSITSSGDQVGAPSFDSDISAGGRYVAFSTDSSRLVAGDTNNTRDVFVRDRRLHVTRRVSVSTGGVQGNDFSSQPAISDDGRYVAFISAASNLVDGDSNQRLDVFVRDRVAKVTRRVSVATGGKGGNGISYNPAISGDGRYVAFNSEASNLVAGDTNGVADVFVRDLERNVTSRVSVGAGGAQANGSSDSAPAISADGRYVAFQSSASNLVAGDTNGTSDVFVRNRMAKMTRRVSVGMGGADSDNPSGQPDISADGRYVAFSSDASNLVVGDTNSTSDVFVRDRLADETSRVSVGRSGAEANSYSFDPAISADGLYVAFTSRATNLVATDTNGKPDVFVRERVADVTRRVSVSSGGAQGNGASDEPAISAHGRHVTFTSKASNLIAADTNNTDDVFVRDRGR